MNDTTTTNPTVKVGSLFCMSWGYDQTNVNFFQVTRLSPEGIFVREIGYKTVPGSEGFMNCKVVAEPNKFLSSSSWCKGTNVETARRFNGGDKPSFSMGRSYWAFLTTETQEHYNSWYA
jgi:hypothetical protein